MLLCVTNDFRTLEYLIAVASDEISITIRIQSPYEICHADTGMHSRRCGDVLSTVEPTCHSENRIASHTEARGRNPGNPEAGTRTHPRTGNVLRVVQLDTPTHDAGR